MHEGNTEVIILTILQLYAHHLCLPRPHWLVASNSNAISANEGTPWHHLLNASTQQNKGN